MKQPGDAKDRFGRWAMLLLILALLVVSSVTVISELADRRTPPGQTTARPGAPAESVPAIRSRGDKVGAGAGFDRAYRRRAKVASPDGQDADSTNRGSDDADRGGAHDSRAAQESTKPEEEVQGRRLPDESNPGRGHSQGDDRRAATRRDAVPEGVRTIQTLPKSDAEIEAAYENAADFCELVPAHQAIEIHSFTPFLTPRDGRRSRNVFLAPSARRQIFSIGLEVAPEDQPTLPGLSRRQILHYLREHYVSVQCRIQRHATTGRQYLHHRPLAATAAFDGLRLTRETTEAVVSAVRELRSLGLLVASDDGPTPEDLRTLVLVHRHVHTPPAVDGLDGAQPNYELVIVRARESADGSEPIDLHVFATTEQRRQFHYLWTGAHPGHLEDCSIQTAVLFTEFTHGGLYPKDSVVRRPKLISRATVSLEELNNYVRSHGWSGDAYDNLTVLLDAIIDSKLVPDSVDGG